jgi:hypothetical protein
MNSLDALARSTESACYRIRRHSSQVGEGKRDAHALKEALESSGLRLRVCKAKKALPENRNQFCPEHWEVRVTFYSFADKIQGDKIAAPFMAETFKLSAL